ncbi:hypothetical protein FRB93_008594 [Tulasnella sp. JGI-2019a]|nr:hypothetical protein FRB93_008594 [Tulasnella sp. JGI-2019a]
MPYAIGYASGRPMKCNKNGKSCKVKDRAPTGVIKRGELQFGISFEVNGTQLYTWKHWECIGQIQETNVRRRFGIGNVDELEGYSGLNDVDKARVDAMLGIVRPPPTAQPNTTPGTSKKAKKAKNTPASKAAPPLGPAANTNPRAKGAPQPPNANATGAKGKGPKPKSTPAPAPAPTAAPPPASSSSSSQGQDHQSKSKPKPKVEPPQPGKSTPSEDLKELGNMHFRNGSYETAIDFYGQAIAIKPDPTYYTNRAAAHMALKRFQLASDDCKVAMLLQDQAPSSKTLGRLAKCHLALGDPDAAMKVAQAAIDCDSLSGTHPALSTKVSAEEMKQHLDQSRDAWGEKRWSDAKDSLENAATLCEGDCPPQWWVWEIEIEMARSNWDEAIDIAEKAEKLHLSSVDIQVASAQVLLLTGRLALCFASLRSALRKDPEHTRAAELLRRLKTIDQAQQEGDRLGSATSFASAKYTEALNVLGCLDEEGHGGHLRFNLLVSRADAYVHQKSFDLARADCQAAMSIPNHPSPLKVLNNLAKCHIALGDPTAALQALTPAFELDPRNAVILATKSSAETMETALRLSREAWVKQDWLEAKNALARAEAECTGDCLLEWWIWKVEIAIAMRALEEAVRIAENVIELFPGSAHAFAILGLALMLSNKLDFCSEALQFAVCLDPEHTLASETSRRVGDIEKLKEAGNQAFKFGKYPEAIQRYTETLEIIGSSDEESGGGYLRAVILSNRATALLKIERHARALTDIKASLELQPTSFKALRTHARIRKAQGYYNEAITIYSKARAVWLSGDMNAADGEAIDLELKSAEASLKTSRSKNYHEILSIPKGASEADIKKAYRRSSLHFHPDKGGNPEHFKLVSQAYNALLDQDA